jgi:hypothetical protein
VCPQGSQEVILCDNGNGEYTQRRRMDKRRVLVVTMDKRRVLVVTIDERTVLRARGEMAGVQDG